MRVEDDFVGAQLPHRILLRAGREAHVIETNLPIGSEVHDVRGAVRGWLVQLELCGAEVRAFVLRVVSADARHMHERVGVLDTALELHGMVRRVVVRMVGAQLAIPLQHLHVTLQDRVAAHAESRRVTGDVEGRAGTDARGARADMRCAADARRRAGEIIRRGGADHRLIRTCIGDHDEQWARDHKGPVPARR